MPSASDPRSTSSPALLASLTDIRAQVDGLVHAGFVTEAGAARLPDVVRYLTAVQRRLEKLPERHDRDQVLLHSVKVVREAYDTTVAHLPPARRGDDDVREIPWMIQELRVSLFGNGLKTTYPVSEQRVAKAIRALAP